MEPSATRDWICIQAGRSKCWLPFLAHMFMLANTGLVWIIGACSFAIQLPCGWWSADAKVGWPVGIMFKLLGKFYQEPRVLEKSSVHLLCSTFLNTGWTRASILCRHLRLVVSDWTTAPLQNSGLNWLQHSIKCPCILRGISCSLFKRCKNWAVWFSDGINL